MTVLAPPRIPATLRVSILAKLRPLHDGDHADLCAAIDDMLAFLDGCDGDGRRPPTPLVDDAWHAFILHTADYAAYCQARFGRFIHHRPDGPDCEPGDCRTPGCNDDPNPNLAECKYDPDPYPVPPPPPPPSGVLCKESTP